MSQMICQNCYNTWDSQDLGTGYWFRSESFSVGSYASPYQIDQEGEEITYCPKCPDGRLYPITREMDNLVKIKGSPVAEGRTEARETASRGDADVVHEGEIG